MYFSLLFVTSKNSYRIIEQDLGTIYVTLPSWRYQELRLESVHTAIVPKSPVLLRSRWISENKNESYS